ncbi:hypothetical protein E2562_021478 [Oryza meyeriana var. granulata]|uniref:Uncharacterized protein n=1 Tax=Oryza meyeriana var. granulata TaxID=110450 RepID=A0A6G1DZN0_9ORYZ|nr:hypothetical protein E2562_021478 [Oryza meyeriana var. granulata]
MERRLAGGEKALGREEDIGHGEELVGTGKEGLRVHRALGQPLVPDGAKYAAPMPPHCQVRRPYVVGSAAPMPLGPSPQSEIVHHP